jgi:NAD(P)H-dependent FMN reductase
MKTLIISSSLSPESRSFILCKEVYDRLKKKRVDVELVDSRKVELLPHHKGPTDGMKKLIAKMTKADNVIFGMGVHNYSVNDSLKIILDSFPKPACNDKFFGIVCAAGGNNSYLSTMHLTQMCMNEWRMIQLPRIVYATGRDYQGDKVNENILERIDQFCDDFVRVGKKLA